MTTPGYYLGIDGGGTKTEAVIVDENCQLMGSGRADGSNLHNFPIDSAMDHIRQATDLALADMYKNHRLTPPSIFLSSCIGLAGLDTPDDIKKITRYFSGLPSLHWPIHTQKLLVTKDGLVGLRSGTDKSWGICIVSSTGSNCYGINQAGKEATAGDWGHLLGDQGSSYAIGLKLVRIVMKEYDGRRPTSLLTEKVLTQLKIKTIPELVTFMYQGPSPVKAIASLTHLYADPELSENEDLLKMIRSCSGELTLAYQSVVNRLELTNTNFPVVLIGGLFSLTQQLTEIVTGKINQITPQAEIIIPGQVPAMGAAKLALDGNTQSLYPETTLVSLTV